jgi:DNA (cytosine-5)-methyltransferase 1
MPILLYHYVLDTLSAVNRKYRNSAVTKNSTYPVIDLFAGPGGLGEGFASLRQPQNRNIYAFKTAISIEKDPDAHKTLELRHFFREFPPDAVPEGYYSYLNGEISLEELYLKYSRESAIIKQKAWLCTLGEEPHSNVKKRISDALTGYNKWVLVGGPPCQAYSLAGRSRMMGDPEFQSDSRHFLYKEYLKILADHQPPVFIMENVKGILSAKINNGYVIHEILQDLSQPELAVFGHDSGLRYKLYSLSESGSKDDETDPVAFVVKAEEYGIPQARHRIFILGIRNDIDVQPLTLEKTDTCRVVDIIGNMPELRSAISKEDDSDELWKQAIAQTLDQAWLVKGRTNGLADLVTLADEVIRSMHYVDLKKSSTVYTPPDVLKNWFYDGHLTVLTSHEARSHMRSDLHRYFYMAMYARVYDMSPRLSDFPKDLLPQHKNVEAGVSGDMFPDRFRVQLPNAPATTITSHISKDGHYFIHYDPKQCRSLTVREAARLQTFPDNYKFEGNRTAQYHQVGNAVPPLLASKIAEIVYEVLEAID